MILQRLFFSLILSLCGSFTAYAVNLNLPPQYEIPLQIPATLPDTSFGATLAASGNTAAVVAVSDGGNGTGAVYLYNAQENWRLTTELYSRFDADDFGKYIVLNNNILIVSADRDDEQGIDSGAVYVFERNPSSQLQPWQQTARITALDAQAGDRFGNAIALYNDILYIGAPNHGQGKVYMFSRNNEPGQWQLLDSINPADPQALRFGAAIAQDRGVLVIGAPLTDANDELVPEAKRSTQLNQQRQSRFAISKGDTVDPGVESGAIFVYENKDGVWQEIARLGASNRETGDHLGAQIAIEQDVIVASVKQKDVFDDLRAGALYVYNKHDGRWQEDTALVAPDSNVGANFGISFSLLDKHILVGANKIHANGFNSGQVFLFAQDHSKTWQLTHIQSNAAIQPHDQLGRSVALGQEYMLAASKNAVYAFQNTPITYYPAVFYPASNAVQLNEIVVPELGVFRVDFHLTQQQGDFILTMTGASLRTDIQAGDIQYLNSTAPVNVPRLVVQSSSGETTAFTVVLQQIQGSVPLQFRVVSFSPLEN